MTDKIEVTLNYCQDRVLEEIVERALEHKDAIDMAICEITDEDGYPNESLIEE